MVDPAGPRTQGAEVGQDVPNRLRSAVMVRLRLMPATPPSNTIAGRVSCG
ncbi:hypothetical protein BZL30_1089 [Mycobacterium kansasii]|uniref:Uncharacterized protein n=1 Tax=Mycobacterium kansasii TaxID=1768 RepID=A0A1V3XTA9_MYCKA|nr:hypothetical protein BZL30_1089 [Mycobacterium kansasii]